LRNFGSFGVASVARVDAGNLGRANVVILIVPSCIFKKDLLKK